ncbi:Tol-Pal system beta propeller repeat protein TolB [Frigidibacter sp. SD6-1]|uniref:Tol-Pal system beta propeller repeat protein TolB n=1 Tax=Frigidibacter sp. SD6-1 TaxID=3032581 RepID=UPI0024DFF8E8|nr:Tol-Pal system beta propeller repeat protein TolB [Frigidibacter sp. SD6-1]
MLNRVFVAGLLLFAALVPPGSAQAQDRPRIVFDNPVIEPLPYALPTFVDEGGAADVAQAITDVIRADLTGTGLLKDIPTGAYISQVTSFDAPVAFADWKAINAQVLISGAVAVGGDGRINVKFRLHDVFAGEAYNDGFQFGGGQGDWRRIAHKIADAVYHEITGEGPYFDSRVVFVSESGPKDARQKQLAIMDYDGANVQYLTDASAIVLAPRFSAAGDRILYTSFDSGFPRIKLMDLATLQARAIADLQGNMTFAPRFSPDGDTVVFSLENDGNTDLYAMSLSSGQTTQLTNAPSIETAPSFSPDGSQIAFESDRSGNQQIYIMPVSGGEPVRVSSGEGRYSTPVWSPRGDLVAFTKQNGGRFHIGVMRTDGSEERLLTASYLDEGPTWAPNGRVIMFTRESPGAAGSAQLYSVDISGRALRQVPTVGAASDPAWSPLLP